MIRGGAKNKTSLRAMGVGAAPPCEPALPVQHSYNRCHRVMPTYQLVYGISLSFSREDPCINLPY